MKFKMLIIAMVFAAILIPGAGFGAVSQEGKADGQLTVGGKVTRLTYAYARAQKGFFDEKTEDVLVILSDVPLDTAALADDFTRIDLAKAGKLHALEVTINDKQQPISASIRHNAFAHPVGGGSSEDAFEAQTFDGKVAAGRLFRKTPGESFDDIPFTYDASFRAVITRAGK